MVFISHSDKDADWAYRLSTQLKVLTTRAALTLWTPTKQSALYSRANYWDEIKEALETASVVIMLVSPRYLASEFIVSRELPAIKRRHQRGQLIVIPVIIQPTLWEADPWLAKFRVFPREGKSLAEKNVDAELAALARHIWALVSRVSSTSAPLAISRVRLTNVRGFKEFELESRSGSRDRILVIGRNGTCKTTLLRALALSLCDPIDAGALITEPIGTLVGTEGDTAEIEVDLNPRSGEPATYGIRLETWNSEGKDSIRDNESRRPPSSPFVCAYGAGRFGVGTDTGREYRALDSVASLFDYRRTLIDSELTLRRLQDYLGTKRFESTLSGIKRVLGLEPEDEISLPKGGGVEVSGPSIGKRIRLEGWADGYRMTFAWLLDLYGWAMRADRVKEDGGIEGILLLDEIEQHLHPSMQLQILPRLSEILPSLQIFATTHSPLVALGANPGEVVSLRREGGAVIAEPSVPDFSDYSAEDMLADQRLFNSAVHKPETSAKLERYRSLAKIPPPKRTDEETHELEELATDLRSEQILPAQDSEAAAELRRLVAKHGL